MFGTEALVTGEVIMGWTRALTLCAGGQVPSSSHHVWVHIMCLCIKSLHISVLTYCMGGHVPSSLWEQGFLSC